MTINNFIDKLEWDTNIITLKKYLDGKKPIPLKSELERNLVMKQLPSLIKKQEESNEEFLEDFINSKLTHLAVYKLQKDNARKGKKYFNIAEVSKVMLQIIQKVGQEHNNKNVRKMLDEFLQKEE